MSVEQYRARCAQRAENIAMTRYHHGDITINVVSLLTDIRHACDKHGLSYAELDRAAQDNYVKEKMA